MPRIADAFARMRDERRVGLVTYVTAGDPDLERTADILRALDRAGADVIELGVPFSDPLADGPVIQRAMRAGAGGRRDARPACSTWSSEVRPSVARAARPLLATRIPIYRMGFERVRGPGGGGGRRRRARAGPARRGGRAAPGGAARVTAWTSSTC